MNTVILAALVLGLFHFSEGNDNNGKPCPEETRPHTSQCDSYFRCLVLPSKTHVWVPTKCERGLIFEPNLRLCVLPEEDWECTLGDTLPQRTDDNNVYGVNALQTSPSQQSKLDNSDKTKLLLTDEPKISEVSEETEYLEVNNAVNNSSSTPTLSNDKENVDDIYEPSGDGSLEDTMEIKDGGGEIPKPSKVDPKLAAHLQRLSQLIDGLKKKYQNKPDDASHLRPDQLNAFLAHYNIRSQFDSLNPAMFDKRPAPQNGIIDPAILQQIIKKQQELQAAGLSSNTSMKVPTLNFADNFNQLQSVTTPSTQSDYNNEAFINGSPPEKHYRRPDGYGNSQIAPGNQDRPPIYGFQSNDKYQPRPTPEQEEPPRITEETLKTILELSKQLLASQNIRQVVSNNPIYQPLVQPMYVPVPLINPHQGNNYPNKYLPQTGYENEDKYQKISSSSYPKPDRKQKPSFSIVQSNALPITISGNSYSGMVPGSSPPSNTDQSNLQLYYQNQVDRVDSYGNKVQDEYNQRPDKDESFPPYQAQNSVYSTTLHPPLNYDLAPHVGTSSYQSANTHTGNKHTNTMYNPRPSLTSPSLSLPYPNDPNRINETPRPILQQLLQQPLYSRPSPANGQQSLPLLPSSQSLYTSINAFPTPPKLRPINPSSVNIRPNSIQSSASEAGLVNSEADMFPDSAESQFQYNQNSINNQFVSDLLASNLDHSHSTGNTHLVNLGGNFVSYDVYKNQILPAAAATAASNHGVEIITCAAGVRQPNTTDCTKYYVCSKKNGKVLSYSCPPYTGFNPQTHICDARTYAFCNPQSIYNRFTVSENRKVQMDAYQVLDEAKRVRDQAIQAQNLANLIRLETQKVINQTIMPQGQGLREPVILSNYLANYQQNSPSLESSLVGLAMAQTSPAPIKLVPTKRRRIHCTDGAKVPDPQSVMKYYVCFKSSDGKMKRRKMTCTNGLMFCAQTHLCTLPRKCNA